MKAIEMTEFGDVDVLKYVTKEIAPLGKEQVKIKLYYAGVNPAEAYIRQGGYAFFNQPLPYTPGFDGAGVIEEIGEDVTNYKIGDRVFIASALGEFFTGTYAQWMITSTDSIRHLGETTSFETGAALGIPATAAYRALFQRGQLKKGESVLIHGASGGVGILTLQMAKDAGAYVIGTAGNKENMEKVRANGADLVLNHNEEGYLDKIDGVDLVIEMLANVNLEKDLEVLNTRGRVMIIGNRGSLDFNPRLTMAKEADIRGIAIWNATQVERAESLDAIEEYLTKKVLKPEIGPIYALEKASQAQHDIIHEASKGKILLKCN